MYATRGFQCRRSRICAVNGCRVNHHRLLHLVRAQNICSNSQRLTVRSSPERASKVHTNGTVTAFAARSDDTTEPSAALTTKVGTEGKHQTLTDRSFTTVTLKPSEAPHFVACRTVSVILKNGNHRLG